MAVSSVRIVWDGEAAPVGKQKGRESIERGVRRDAVGSLDFRPLPRLHGRGAWDR